MFTIIILLNNLRDCLIIFGHCGSQLFLYYACECPIILIKIATYYSQIYASIANRLKPTIHRNKESFLWDYEMRKNLVDGSEQQAMHPVSVAIIKVLYTVVS